MSLHNLYSVIIPKSKFDGQLIFCEWRRDICQMKNAVSGSSREITYNFIYYEGFRETHPRDRMHQVSQSRSRINLAFKFHNE